MKTIFQIITIGTVCSLLYGCRAAQAEPISDMDAVRAILGEAEGEPYEGKVAIAYAIRNRGTLKGVYGKQAVIAKEGHYWRGTRRISSRTAKEALEVWNRAKTGVGLNMTNGATHWENIKAFGVPYWAEGKTPCYVIGSHAFYKDIR